MSNMEIAKVVIDKCSQQELMNPEILDSITKAQHISNCLNQELGAYGIKTLVSPDKNTVFIDNNGMSQVLNFFEGKSAQPVITTQQVERVQNILESANENKIDLVWLQTGLKKNTISLNSMGSMELIYTLY